MKFVYPVALVLMSFALGLLASQDKMQGVEAQGRLLTHLKFVGANDGRSVLLDTLTGDLWQLQWDKPKWAHMGHPGELSPDLRHSALAAVELRKNEAMVNIVKSNFSTLEGAIDMFKLDHGTYPKDADDLVNGPVHPLTNSKTQYLLELPQDPWTGKPFLFGFTEGGRPRFISYGADQAEGGEGVNADIFSSE